MRTTNLMSGLGLSAWGLFLALLWATWWGGLSFYAIVVVPVGTSILGSAEQGFVTQRVTHWHNVISCVFLACLLIEAFRRKSRSLGCICAGLALIDVALVAGHSHLTSMMDFSEQTVPVHFYARHGIYLSITAAEWTLGMIVPACLFQCGSASPVRAVNPGSS